jgi:predicted nucleic acid-binding protein
LIVYFDTSVLVAYYTAEDRSSAAAAIVERAELPVISDICIAEFNVVIRRKQRDGFLSDQRLKRSSHSSTNTCGTAS